MCFLLLTNELSQFQFTSLLKKNPKMSFSKIPISPTLGFSKLPLTALFKNTWILKFKSQLMFAFFIAANHLSRSLRKQKFVTDGFRSALCLCVASLLVIVIILTAAKNAIAKAAFELQCSSVFEKRSNQTPKLTFNRN